MLIFITTTSYAHWMDGAMYTINPAQHEELEGPVHGAINDSKYRSEVFQLVIQNAHKHAKKYLEMGDSKAYWTFMVLALTVPVQESGGYHFRKAKNRDGLCGLIPTENTNPTYVYAIDGKKLERPLTSKEIAADPYLGVPSANMGDMIPRSSKNENNPDKVTSYKNFKKFMRDGRSPFLANCSKVKNDRHLLQMMRGFDGTDIGIMQISIRWFYKNYLPKAKFKSVDKTLYFAQNLLRSGFDKLYRDFNKYPCLYKGGGFFRRGGKTLIHNNLIKGIWGGKYNAGNTKVKSVCRFADKNSKYYESHDKVFALNLKNVLKGKAYKEMAKAEYNAYKEILKNYKKNKNNTKYVSQFIRF